MPKRKISTEIKMWAVEQVRQGRSADETAKELGVHPSLVRWWVSVYEYHGIEGLERKHQTYSGEFKKEVIDDVRENGLSYRQAAAKYNIGNHVSIQKWERIYLEQGMEGLCQENRGKASKEVHAVKGRRKKQEGPDADLIAELQRLRMENEYLKKLNALVRSKGK